MGTVKTIVNISEISVPPACIKISNDYSPSCFLTLHSYAGGNYVTINMYIGYIGTSCFVKALSVKNDGPNGALSIFNQGNIIIYFNSTDSCLYIWHDWNGGISGTLYSVVNKTYAINTVSNADFTNMTKLFELKDYNGQPSF